MSDYNMVEMLSREGNGAIRVDEAFDSPAPVVVLIGPIRVWWSEWGSPRHQEYTRWRDAVRVACVKAGCAVYSPHRAIQGRWNKKLQRINNAAIIDADIIINLTPMGVPAEGTMEEVELAKKHLKLILNAPPSDDERIAFLIRILEGYCKTAENIWQTTKKATKIPTTTQEKVKANHDI